jgi:hypothetical protein
LSSALEVGQYAWTIPRNYNPYLYYAAYEHMPINEQIAREKFVVASHLNRQKQYPKTQRFVGTAETILQTATGYLPPVVEPKETGITTNSAIDKAVAGVQSIIAMDDAATTHQKLLKLYDAPIIDTYDPQLTLPWYRENHKKWLEWSTRMNQQKERYDAEQKQRAEAILAQAILDRKKIHKNRHAYTGRAPR